LCAAYDVEEWEAECTGEYSIHIGSTVDKVFKGITPEGLPCTVLIDYKSGRGVQVDAVGNEQLLHNAWCLMENSPAQDLFDDAKVLVGVIIQPDRAGEVVAKDWRFNKQDVELFAARHLANIDLARSGKAKPNAGSHCTFCPAAATCPAKTGAARAALLRDPANIAELAENMAMGEELKKWCNAVEKATYETLELGQEVPGWKLVAKRAMEHWTDEDLATKRLRLRVGGIKNLMVQKLISPAEARKRLVANGMEKSVADQMVSNLTKKESSGTTIAPETDKRPGVLSTEALSAALASVV